MEVTQFFGGAVAQLGARLDGIEEVVGSNPIGSTSFLGSGPETCEETSMERGTQDLV
jgi:hypothetical protein